MSKEEFVGVFNCHQKCIDQIPLDDEEPFTLETYRNLIQRHHERGHPFIIAQVHINGNRNGAFRRIKYLLIVLDVANSEQTLISTRTLVEPRSSAGQNKAYYYSAHFLNKVLFRRHGIQGLLFRLNAMNPLTNSEIVGDVQYYEIACDGKMTATSNITLHKVGATISTGGLLERVTAVECSSVKVAEICYVDPKHSNSPRVWHSVNALDKDSCAVNNIKESMVELDSAKWSNVQAVPVSGGEKLVLLQKSSSAKQFENVPFSCTENVSAAGKYNANYMGMEDDYLSSPDMRAHFLLSALDPNDAILFEIDPALLEEEGIYLSAHELSQSMRSMDSDDNEIHAASIRTSRGEASQNEVYPANLLHRQALNASMNMNSMGHLSEARRTEHSTSQLSFIRLMRRMAGALNRPETPETDEGIIDSNPRFPPSPHQSSINSISSAPMPRAPASLHPNSRRSDGDIEFSYATYRPGESVPPVPRIPDHLRPRSADVNMVRNSTVPYVVALPLPPTQINNFDQYVLASVVWTIFSVFTVIAVVLLSVAGTDLSVLDAGIGLAVLTVLVLFFAIHLSRSTMVKKNQNKPLAIPATVRPEIRLSAKIMVADTRVVKSAPGLPRQS